MQIFEKNIFLDGKLYGYSKVNGELLKAADANQVRAAHQTMIPSHKIAAYMSFKFSIKGSKWSRLY